MIDERTTFLKTAVRPMDCLSESWELQRDVFWLFVGITFVGILLSSLVPLGILTGPLFCGIFFCWFRRMRGEPVTFEMLFRGFDYFVESLVATLILTAVMLVILVPSYILLFVGMALTGAAGQDNPELFGAVFVILVLLVSLVIISVVTLIWTFALFTYPLIVDRGLKAIPALKTSYHATMANLGGVLGLLTITSLIGLVAALLCYLPVFLVAPWCIGSVAIAYRRIFPELMVDAGVAKQPPPMP
jgi:hypothetical protein